MPGFQSQSMNLAFYGGFTCFLESNRTEQPSLSSPDPLPTKTTKAGIAPSPRCNVISKFRRKKNSCYLYIVMLSTNFKKKRIKDATCSYLRKLISPYGFGWSKPGGVDRYTNEQLIRWYNASGYMGTPTNSDLYAHFAGQDTLYFWADGRKSSPLTLSMIDIDCHERGNAQSAKAFADWLKDNYFPSLYPVVSRFYCSNAIQTITHIRLRTVVKVTDSVHKTRHTALPNRYLRLYLISFVGIVPKPGKFGFFSLTLGGLLPGC